ncbi:MAG TPA: hypothetical protein P5349_07235 [Tenuifilaceae bacterium]|nr:hypothetical protein [Tenuifilaceae bacterium]
MKQWEKIVLLFLVTIFLFNSPFTLKGQNVTKVVRVKSGGIISINFNSINEYSSGKSLNSWSRLNISFADTTDVGGDGTSIGWKLSVRAGSSAIISDGASPNLALSNMEIRPTTTIPGTTVTNIVLSDADQEIVSGPDPGTTTTTGEVVLSYDCGITTPLLGTTPDYYYVELIFTLVELP